MFNFSSNAAHAKARAMYAKRIKPEEYAALVRKRSVGEIAEFLKKKEGFSKALERINPALIHRGQLEALLRFNMFDKLERLYSFAPASNRGFFEFAVRLYETDEILRFIMNLNLGNPEGFIADIPEFLREHSTFDIYDLARVKDTKGLMEVLKETPYAKILSELGEDIKNYTACELALKSFVYLKEIEKAEKKYGKTSGKRLAEIIEESLWLTNICTIFRAKLIFEKSPEEIEKLLYPVKNALLKSIEDKLSSIESKEDFFRVIYSTPYGRHITKDEEQNIENVVWRIRHIRDKRLIYLSSDTDITLYAFSDLMNIEYFNITNIIEGVRYKADPSEISKLLII